MRYIHFFGDNGYCGTEYHEFMAFEDEISDDEINDISNDFADDNAETYEYVATGWGNDFDSEQEREDYYEMARYNCDWAEVSKKEFEELKEDYGMMD